MKRALRNFYTLYIKKNRAIGKRYKGNKKYKEKEDKKASIMFGGGKIRVLVVYLFNPDLRSETETEMQMDIDLRLKLKCNETELKHYSRGVNICQ